MTDVYLLRHFVDDNWKIRTLRDESAEVGQPAICRASEPDFDVVANITI